MRLILLSILISIIFVSTVLIITYNIFPHGISSTHPFYSEGIDQSKKQVFLFGSSQMGTLNNTLINEHITNKFPDYVVYNLAYAVDNPLIRIQSIPQIIDINPEIIIYGISYRDLIILKNDNDLLPNPFTQKIIKNDHIVSPKLVTISAIKKIAYDLGLFPESVYYLENTPFNALTTNQKIIASDEELDKLSPTIIEQTSLKEFEYKNNERIETLEKIFTELHKNNIQLVLYITPLHKNYIPLISNDNKNSFDKLTTHLSEKFDLKVYDYSEKYSDMPIWSDIVHIAYHKNSMIYSEDLAKIIINEIER